MKRRVCYGVIVVLVATVCLTSCGEAGGGPAGGSEVEAPSKKLKQVDYDVSDMGKGVWTRTFEWDGDNLIKCEFWTDGSVLDTYTFSYSNGRLDRVLHEESDGTAVVYTYTWDADNHIAAETVQMVGEDGQDKYLYSYAHGKPSCVQNVSTGASYDVAWAGDNVASMFNGSVTYSYDSHPNPIRLFAGFEPAFLFGAYGHHLWSANNITSCSMPDEAPRSYSYTYGSDGYPQTVTMSVDGASITGAYTYDE